MIRSAIHRLLQARDVWRLPAETKHVYRRELCPKPGIDPGIGPCVDAAMEWLCRAQQLSSTADGGVARHFSLVEGWGASYPETTGYIIPTLIVRAQQTDNERLRIAARNMLDWICSIQLQDGGFQGGTITDTPVMPVVFNTGQILMGLSAGTNEFGEQYRESMTRAAQWLVDVQDEDGCWRNYESPFARSGDKTYDTHVAWGLLEAARTTGDERYSQSALRNIHWAIGRQRNNGWFEDCCLTDPSMPLTHTIGYTLRGIIEGFRYFGDGDLLEAAVLTGDGLLGALARDGSLPGRLDNRWKSGVPWVCLTGNVQIAHCWLQLYEVTGNKSYLLAGQRANEYVRRTVFIKGSPDTCGGIRGSFPVYGEYGQFQYLNWAAKFFVDSNLLQKEIEEKLP